MDPRIKKLAKILVNYSVKLKKGQLVRIQGEVVTIPLLNAVFEEAVNVGANPFIKVRIPENEEYLYKNGTDAQLKYISPVVKYETDKIDVLIHIWGSQNTRSMSGVNPKRQALGAQAMRPLRDKMFKRMASKSLVWVGTQFPTYADAQDADMSLEDYENFVYSAGHINAADPVKHWMLRQNPCAFQRRRFEITRERKEMDQLRRHGEFPRRRDFYRTARGQRRGIYPLQFPGGLHGP